MVDLNLVEWLMNFIGSVGYIGIIILLTVENLVAVVPSEIVLPFVGFLSAQGEFSLVWAIVAATVGSTLGAWIIYWLGRILGRKRLIWVANKTGKLLLFQEDDVSKSLEWFEKYGPKLVLFGRLLPIIRSIVSLPAGVTHMPELKFLFYSALGGLGWNATLIGLGWWLKSEWQQLLPHFRYAQYIIAGVMLIGIGWFIWYRRRQQKT